MMFHRGNVVSSFLGVGTVVEAALRGVTSAKCGPSQVRGAARPQCEAQPKLRYSGDVCGV